MADERSFDALLLDNQLCFPLYVCSKEIISRYTPFLNKIGLTYTQYITMMVMWEEKEVLSGHLKERLYLDSGTLTPVVRRLVEKGLVTKSIYEKDARDTVVTITEKGEELKIEAVNVPYQVGSCLTDMKDPEKLYSLLREMMEMFKEKNNKKN